MQGSPVIFYFSSIPTSDLINLLIQIAVLLLLLALMLFTLVSNFRKLRRGENILNLKKPLQTILYFLSSLVALIILGISVMILLSLFNGGTTDISTPHFFPLDNPKGEYKITLGCLGGQGTTFNIEESKIRYGPNGTYDKYCVEYTGADICCMGKTNFLRITIGKSKVDLEPFFGKRVKNIKGGWGSANGMAGLNIDSLELAE
ncbi:MAG: hypothetical protein UU67_C0029G0014 [Candidatus Daviesbacteria bacterium GW2011_GWB1_41_5]|uniref:Uncharacterized protein n=1 Tax=Candidatus Daviesbacteria bacterium GW2011_GWB1_41_5 TaxID=1618429 RepID=A0A0G0YU57_9BACT|nr:MAG: hypothetical protein UU67_C0029G0014 [Candidatus Daviesbacteria bacterium GW2011_GWB1_41_5]